MNKSYFHILSEDIEEILKEDFSWKKLMSKTILIAGATSFIATYFVHTCIKVNKEFNLNMKIILLARSLEKLLEKYGECLTDSSIQLIIQDVTEPLPCNIKADIILHAASPATLTAYLQNMHETITANIQGTNILINGLRDSNSIFLFLSSNMVYGDVNNMNISEEYISDLTILPFHEEDVYGIAKAMAEILGLCYQKEKNVDVRIARLFSVFGPGEKLNSGRCIMDFISHIRTNTPIILNSDGLLTHSYCYVSDAVRGLFYILLNGCSGTYNIGNEKEIYSIREIAKICSTYLLGMDKRIIYMGKNGGGG